MQEAFVKAYTSLDRFEGRSSFYTWLYRLVMNQCIDMKRREHGDRHVEWREGDVLEDAELPLAPEAADLAPALPVDLAARSELRERMASAIEKLPDATRETLLLREVDGLSYAEIAEVQGIPNGTVMSRLHYARRKLQELLRGAGVGLEDATMKHAGRNDLELYRDGELSFWARRRVERALRRDPALRRRLEALEAIGTLLRESDADAPTPDLWAGIRLRLVEDDARREAAAEEGGSWLDAWRRPIGVAALGAVAAGSVALALLLTPEAAAPPSVRPAPVGSVRWIDGARQPDDGAARRPRGHDHLDPRAGVMRKGEAMKPLRLLGVAACLAALAASPSRAADPSGPDEVPIEVTVLQTSDQPGESDPRCERFEKLLHGTVAYGSLSILDVHKRSVPVNEVWTLDLPTAAHAPAPTARRGPRVGDAPLARRRGERPGRLPRATGPAPRRGRSAARRGSSGGGGRHRVAGIPAGRKKNSPPRKKSRIS